MSAQVEETFSHASTMKRRSKSPTVANCQSQTRSTPRNNRIRREAACGPARPPHTSQKNMFSRAAKLQLSRHATHFPVIGHSNTTGQQHRRPRLSHADCSATGTRQHVECSQRVRIRRRIESGISIPAVATCVKQSRNWKGHASQTHPSKLLGNGQSRRVCERPHLGKRQLIADIAHPTFTTESGSFLSENTSLLNPMSVSWGLKRPQQKWMARDACRSSSQSCRCTPMFGSGLCSNEI